MDYSSPAIASCGCNNRYPIITQWRPKDVNCEQAPDLLYTQRDSIGYQRRRATKAQFSTFPGRNIFNEESTILRYFEGLDSVLKSRESLVAETTTIYN